MRILVDLQGAQTGSRYRGIGRSATSLTQALVRNRGEHEIFILLNRMLENTIHQIKDDFANLLLDAHFIVFSIPSPVRGLVADNGWRMAAAELVREWTIGKFAPDVLLITSLFEGAGDDAVTSIGRLPTGIPTAVVLHDLIPLLDPGRYLGDPAANRWYHSKIKCLREADLLLAVSNSSRREAVDALDFDPERVVTISSAAGTRLSRIDTSPEQADQVLAKLGIRRKFLMHASRIEPRKNFDGLIRAFALLDPSLRHTHQLVIVGEHDTEERKSLARTASDAGLRPEDLMFTGYVPDSELSVLYSRCALFVFPSFHEGFGLPVLEAMRCGAAVIGSNTTSVPEVIGRGDALFDPHSDHDMAMLIRRVLTDTAFHESLRAHARKWVKRFSWDRTARLALSALEEIAAPRPSSWPTEESAGLRDTIAAIDVGILPDRNDLAAVVDCIEQNETAVAQCLARTSLQPAGDRYSNTGENGDRGYDATFISQLYHVMLGREPDAAGMETYLRAARGGTAPHEIVASFLNSAEFSLRLLSRRGIQAATARAVEGYDATFVRGLYQILLGRDPDPEGLETQTRALRDGMEPHEIVANFVASDEFSRRMLSQSGASGATTAAGRWDDTTFVRNLYRIFHNREPDAQGLESHVAALQGGVEPHQLVANFVNSEEFFLRMVSRRGMLATTSRAGSSAGASDGEPEVEVLRREVWLPEDRPRILLLKLDHIGDFMITLEAFRLIRNTWPRAHITLLCGPWNREVAENSGLFDRVVCCDFYPDTSVEYDKEAVVAQGVEKYRALALGSYDLAVDLRYFDDNRILLSLTDAKYRAGYAAANVPLDLALPASPEPEMVVHNGARAMALAAAVAWTFCAHAGRARKALLNGSAARQLFDEGIVVGIAPGTGNPIKSWGRERYAELARLLHRKGDYRFVLIGGERDRADTEFIAECLPPADVVDLAGTVSIADLAPIVAGLDLFIGNDTGTTHMAALMGIPTLCIYSGQTFVESWGPVGARVVTLRRTVACAPCNLSDIAECIWQHRCMDIPPERVAAEAVRLGGTGRIAAAR